MGSLDEFALQFPCGYCGVEEGAWCVTAKGITRPPGQRAPWLHEARARPIREAWRQGWKDGQAIALESLITELRAARGGEHWATTARVPVVNSNDLLDWLQRRRGRLDA